MEVFPDDAHRSLDVKLRFTRASTSCTDEVGAVLAVGINRFGFPIGEMRFAAEETRPCIGEDLQVPKSETGPSTSSSRVQKLIN